MARRCCETGCESSGAGQVTEHRTRTGDSSIVATIWQRAPAPIAAGLKHQETQGAETRKCQTTEWLSDIFSCGFSHTASISFAARSRISLIFLICSADLDELFE